MAADVLKFLSLRALVTLSLIEKNQKVEKSEWEKFFFLYQLIDKKSELLNFISKEYVAK